MIPHIQRGMKILYTKVDMQKNVIAIAIIIAVVMTGMVVWEYEAAATFPGTIVIPAGNTYLGPDTPTQNPAPVISWNTVTGNMYPYSLSVPSTLKLVTFPQDRYDMYAIDCCGINPSSNVLISVGSYSGALIDYVRGWWQQFSTLKGVAEIVPMTNSNGLKGYRAKYFNSSGATPTVDIFLSPPSASQYVVHLSNGTLDPAIFDKIVDSVSWGH